MRIAIVGGTGGLGYGLAVRLAAAGEDVVIGSRSAERAQSAAARVKAALGARLKGSVAGGANAEIVKDANVVMVTVPFPGQADTYKAIKSSLGPNTTVIDCTVPLASEVGGRPTRMLGVWEGSAAQQARSIVGRDVSLASGFHTIMAATLEAIDLSCDQDILICGDPEARKVGAEVVGLLPGARCVDCGGLETARILESLTALLIGINGRYKLHPGAGLRVTG
ncbi:MAG: 8-hydroxy-5-deazaflavin:NADPH oxidoreductase, partial [Actinomycetota bacterium]|nr:8-hydroxy-5-deazaflavin:NADPH oxidoreductase [Actinomycetota bacterium]